MAFVLDEKGNYLPVLGESAGGGGGTSDHAQLTNLDYASAGHTGFMSSANYLPDGTTITVASSGGDYTKLSEAVAFLQGKWSDGAVTISIANGTYTESETVFVNTSVFNIPFVDIVGTDRELTILNHLLYIGGGKNCKVRVKDFTVLGSGGADSLLNIEDTMVFVQNILFKNSWAGVYGRRLAEVNAYKIYGDTLSYGIYANEGGKIAVSGTLTLKDVGTAVAVNWGAWIILNAPTKAFTNVTADSDVTPGSMNILGIISGNFA